MFRLGCIEIRSDIPRAAAMVQQHKELSHCDAVQNILGRDRTLNTAYRNELLQS
jgi:hypothetical protein